MKEVFAYIRVSTIKQGETGSSLQEQRDAITAYAQRHGFYIAQWFEEMETAAKRGRREFTKMLALLHRDTVRGVIIHKIDRSARNLQDWADLGELMDKGIEVHFAHESLDLRSRGGRLSADIQAVVAADYVRNLRQEVRKGISGRLKQGLYPLPAPIGYRDMGKGAVKKVDPVTAPLVRKAFELYATESYNLEQLRDQLHRLGLRNKRGGIVTTTGLSVMLNNPFYIGLIRIKRTGQVFPGIHELLISKALFDRVQAILRGKTHTKIQRHAFLFRRMMRCRHCGYAIIGERQKGHVYYRCHTKSCPRDAIREERIDEEMRARLWAIRLRDDELLGLQEMIDELRADMGLRHEDLAQSVRLQLQNIESRLSRLMDAFLDGTIEGTLFEQKKRALLLEKIDTEERLAATTANKESVPKHLEEFLELTKTLPLSYEMGIFEEKREILKTVTSNLYVDGKNVAVELRSPFQDVANRQFSLNGAPYRDTPRTDMAQLFDRLVAFFRAGNEVPMGGEGTDTVEREWREAA